MAPQVEASEEFVARFLETGTVDAAALDDLCRAHAPETTRLEFKGGDWLRPSKKRGRRGHPEKPGPKLCAWVSAFANTAGGVLVVGLAEAKKQGKADCAGEIDGETCRALGSTSAEVRGRAESMLQPVAARLPFPPRMQVVEHRRGLVLVVGVERSPDLIPADEESTGPPVYFVRSYSGTVALEEHVAADLLVGRRARPALTARIELNRSGARQRTASVRLAAHIENVGLTWLDALSVGFIGPVVPTLSPLPRPLPRMLATSIEGPEYMQHVRAVEGNHNAALPLPPFGTQSHHGGLELPMPPSGFGTLGLAMYATSPGHPPTWWQVEVELGRDLPDDWRAIAKRCPGRRPRVYGFEHETR